MTVMDFPSSPINGQTTTDGRYYFDSSVGATGAWRSSPLPVGGLPAGSIIQWSSNTAPANWLICDGSAVSRSVYSSLFAVIGTTYGTGDGSTTFNLPDLRGRVPVGKNAGTFGTLAGTGGAETHTLTEAQMPSHQHSLFIWNPGYTAGAYNSYRMSAVDNVYTNAGASGQTSATGGGQAHNNLQPYLVVNYIIKATAGWTAGDSELATRVGAVETANASTNKSGLVPVTPSSIAVNSGTASVGANGIITFAGTSVLNINGCFSSTYTNYRVVIAASASGHGAGVFLRARKAGVDTSNQVYFFGGSNGNLAGTVSGWASGSSGTFAHQIGATSIEATTCSVDICRPYTVNERTVVSSLAFGYSSGTYTSINTTGMVYDLFSYDGFTVYLSAGTFNGTIQVYGYR